MTSDQIGSNTTAITHYNRTHQTVIVRRHAKYLNNMIEQDHRAAKRSTNPTLGFKSFWGARGTMAGIEVMHALRKGQLAGTQATERTPAEQF